MKQAILRLTAAVATALLIADCASTATQPSTTAMAPDVVPAAMTPAQPQAETQADVTRATIANGLRVVIVHNFLAPVVTTEMNCLVGSDEVPDGFPGTAHAAEDMMFRGGPGLSRDQLFEIAANRGGTYKADTADNVTQYFYVAPAQDLDVVLHIAASRMSGVYIKDADWAKERGAIEQEVSRGMSNPQYEAPTQLRAQMFTGTPYATSGLGTRPSFDKTTGKMLRNFHSAWYVPHKVM